MKHQLFAFRVPYQATLEKGVLTIALPVDEMGPLFTEEAIKSTEHALGNKDAATLLDKTAEQFHRSIILAQLTPCPVGAAETPANFRANGKEELMRAFEAADVEPAPKGWDKV